MNPTKNDLIDSFGRRKGRKLSDRKDALMKRCFSNHEITNTELTTTPSLSDLFAHPERPLQLEIGFGDGTHLAQMALNNPHINYIGCEPYIPGVAHLVSKIKAYGLENIKIFADDARLLLQQAPPSTIEKIFILFPDPWPKKRHHKRRIISDATLSLLAQFIPEGGEFQLATDHADYAEWMIHHVSWHPCFEWTARSKADWQQPPTGWIQTKYELLARNAGNDAIVFLHFRVKPF